MAVSKVKQRGAIVVMTVFIIIILIGFAALALDLGRLYVLRTEMQNAADAAALAAAAELDGKLNAIADAKIAAKEALSHQGYFADNPELIKTLPPEAFEFYHWIGSENDAPVKPSDCDEPFDEEDKGKKCVTTDDTNAHYIKVRLYPELFGSDGHYRISLYFLPVLSLFVDEGVPQTASTRVSAVAGAGAVLCNLPPILICDPAEGGDALDPGQMVVLKEQGGGMWEPGNFGFLQPPTGLTGSLNKDLALAMANEHAPECFPPRISTLTGGKTSYGRYGLNTRFGIYDTSMEDYKDDFPPAPDIIDYPRDDNLTNTADLKPGGTDCIYDPSTKYGSNTWADTERNECLASYGLDVIDGDSDGWPKSQDPNDSDPAVPGGTYTGPAPYYNQAYHSGLTPPTSGRRYDLYKWELGAEGEVDDEGWESDDTYKTLVRDPLFTPPSGVTIGDADCDGALKDPTKDDCRIFHGDPVGQSFNKSSKIGAPNRRIIFVAMLPCVEMGITGNTPDIDVLYEGGKFAKFFLTEHAPPPPSVDFYAEYLGEGTNKERQNLIHTVIQLYE